MVLTDKTVNQVESLFPIDKVDSITVQDLLFAANSDSGGDDDDKFREEKFKNRNYSNGNEISKENNIGFKCPYLSEFKD